MPIYNFPWLVQFHGYLQHSLINTLVGVRATSSGDACLMISAIVKIRNPGVFVGFVLVEFHCVMVSTGCVPPGPVENQWI